MRRDTTLLRDTTFLPLVLLWSLTTRAAELDILPASAALDGPRASQRFLVEARDQGRFVADETEKAAFAIDNSKVAMVAKDGTVTPLGDGTATLTATVEGRSARAAITVKNANAAEDWSFRNHVLPVLTRTGCNMGSCHGAAA